MTIDTSALVAILAGEIESQALIAAIAASPDRQISALTWFETIIVLHARLGPDSAADFERFLVEMEISIAPFDAVHMRAAYSAWQRYGKGRDRASLNLGDCCAYATADTSSTSLLFKGHDFSRTDIEAAPY